MAEQLSANERAFLQKVMDRASLPDIYDARDLTTVVFRTMRDLMTTETDQKTEAAFKDADIADLWRDDNPIVSFLSRFRPPLDIDSELVLRRIKQEGGVPKNVSAEAVVIAVPLSQHAPIAIECMNAGLHVLTEKLMARTIGQCKEMIAVARKKNVLLAMGARFAEHACFYIVSVWVISYATEQLELAKSGVLTGVWIAAGFQLIAIPAFGLLSDRVGRRPVYLYRSNCNLHRSG